VSDIAGFLGLHPPYDALDADELGRLAGLARTVPVARGTMLVRYGDAPLEHMWVVRTGGIDIVDRGRVVDHLVPGDSVGYVSLLSGLPPAVSLRAAEDSVCIEIPDPRPVLRHPDRLTFSSYGPTMIRETLTRGSALTDAAHHPVSRYLQPIVWCDPMTRVRDLAARMTDERLPCALVDTARGPGIITDHDFRRLVATGAVGLDAPAAVLATRPLLTVPDDTTVATAFLVMVEHGVHHLVVTGPGGRPVGLLRVVDVARADVRDPLVVRAAVESARSLGDLADACRLLPTTAVELFDSGVPATNVGALLSAVGDSVIRRVLAIDADVADAGVPVSWLVMGSLARREVLPSAVVDTAVVWDDAGDRLSAPERAARVRAAAARVLADLKLCGVRRSVGGANADDPRFARSVSQWRRACRGWQHDNTGEQGLLVCTMLADSRAVTAHHLGRAVTDKLVTTRPTPQFLYALTEHTLAARPPTGFVRDFVVEHSGQHRGQLNLKVGGLRPVTAIGRWAAVLSGDTRGSTPTRLRRAGEAGLLSADEVDSLVAAFEQIFGLLMAREIEAIREARPMSTYMDPRDLDSLTRRHLRESFRAIAHIQSRIEAERPLRMA